MKLRKALRVALALLPAFLFLSGTLFLSAYYAQFAVSTTSINSTLGSLQSSNTDFIVSHNEEYFGFEGETPYVVDSYYLCNDYDENGCIDPMPDLCPYIAISPVDGESMDVGFNRNPYNIQATGELNVPIDETDIWNLEIKSPCFEGECPADYNSEENGAILAQSEKGKTFKCVLEVSSAEFPGSASNYFKSNIAYADLSSSIEVTAVLTGETTSCTEDCFSNVLFLPGIKGSVLETDSDTLWPPTLFSTNDIDQLALSEGGESVNDIYVKGILNTFYNTAIYEGFSDYMDSISGNTPDKIINEWLPLAYDWRFSPEKILEDGIKTETETLDVIAQIEELALSAKSGKVAIVAHSMGGLLGKAIIEKLQDEGKAGLIDSFVMVGSPQLGTPQAIASILHGDSEGILAGFIANPIGMRRIAQNMPSAYNLLPSPKYFNEVADPVISFNTDTLFTQTWRDEWDETINNYSEFFSFMTGTEVVRTEPVETELKDPEVLRPDPLTDASSLHNTYDYYEFPPHIRVVQVAGWGMPTVKSVEYKMYHGVPSYDVKPTVEGDGTVVYPSAVSSGADETYFFDVGKYRKDESTSTQHRDLLSALPIKDLLEATFKQENIIENNYLLSTKPQVTDLEDKLIISTHSPVILGAYDQSGNFTGINQDQDLSAELLFISEDIPGSTFMYTNESQYIFLPKEGIYDFVYKGIGNGPTTVKVDNFSADIVTPIVSYTDMPTTENTEANFVVQSIAPENTTINLDVDGDGTTEIFFPDGTELSLNELLSLIKTKISILVVNDELKQNILQKISNIEKKIKKKKYEDIKVVKNLNNLSQYLMKKAGKGKIADAEAQELVDLLSQIEGVI